MATQPGWETGELSAQAWNFCWLGGKLLPGISEVTSDKSRAIDWHKQKGTDGKVLKDEGNDGGNVTIRLTMWTEEQWQAYQEILPVLDPEQVGGTKGPVEILHPEPNSKGIQTVYVTRISGGAPNAKSGKVEVIECQQYFPLTKSTKSGGTKKKGKDEQIVIPPDVEVNTF